MSNNITATNNIHDTSNVRNFVLWIFKLVTIVLFFFWMNIL